VDVAADGGEPDGPAARGLAISAGGRYMAFASRAGNLLAASGGEAGLPSTSGARATSGGSAQIYLRDTCLGVEAGAKCQPRTVLISGAEGSLEVGADGATEFPSISADGRYVSFTSTADNLVAGVTSAYSQIYVRDTCVGAPAAERCVARTELVSVGAQGAAGKGASVRSSISADGRYVAFDSAAVNLIGAVRNGTANVYMRDTCAGASGACRPGTTLVSANVFGAVGDGASFEPAISGDGRYVVFVTRADDIGAEFESQAVGSARGATQRIVLRDTCIGAVASAGCKASSKVIWGGAEGAAHAPAISGDGRTVTFVSEAGTAGALHVYLWKACAENESACESKPVLLATSSAGDGAALPEGNSRFAAPLSAEAGVVVIFSVEAPPQGVETAKLSGKGDVFLIELP
jgi:Tol biopolymer transport system component